MPIIRKQAKSRFTAVDNEPVWSDSLSLKAKGMLLVLLSLPDNWQFNQKGLQQFMSDREASIKTSLDELEYNGYLSRWRERDEDGTMGESVWVVRETPNLENPELDSSVLENPRLLNTKGTNTKELKTEITYIGQTGDSAGKPKSGFSKPTVDEVTQYISEHGYDVNPFAFVAHYEANGWKVGRNPMKDWRAAVRTWHHRNAPEKKAVADEFAIYD